MCQASLAKNRGRKQQQRNPRCRPSILPSYYTVLPYLQAKRKEDTLSMEIKRLQSEIQLEAARTEGLDLQLEAQVWMPTGFVLPRTACAG